MAHGDTPHDALLKGAWEEFCDGLKAAGDIVFSDTVPATPIDRAEGFRYLSRIIGVGLDSLLENNTPDFPFVTRYFWPTRKQGGDNPDALYLTAVIDGKETYRIVGDRGSAHFVVFTVLQWADTVEGAGYFYGRPQAQLLGRDLKTEWDGGFELVLSPDEHAGNWIKTDSKTCRFTIRQFFGDWERERPMTIRIERVGAEGETPAPLTPERVTESLCDVARFVAGSTRYWAGRMDYLQKEALHTVRPSQARGKLDATSGGFGLVGGWRVQPDEALVIEVTPPKCDWWNFEFGSTWFETMDYRYHLANINSKLAVTEEDGSVRVVVAHQDPGVPNWLDPAGHTQGYMVVRWMQSNDEVVPAFRLIKLAELESALPANARRISPDGRREQVRRRKTGIDRRFRV